MTPITRKEQFYNAILNGTEAPKPVTREEMYLAQIAANGGGGGGGGGSVGIYFVTAEVIGDDFVLTKNYSEIVNAAQDNIVVSVYDENGSVNYDYYTGNYEEEGNYQVFFTSGTIWFATSSTGALTELK